VAYPERLASPLTLPPFIVGLGDQVAPLDTLPPPSPLPLTEWVEHADLVPTPPKLPDPERVPDLVRLPEPEREGDLLLLPHALQPALPLPLTLALLVEFARPTLPVMLGEGDTLMLPLVHADIRAPEGVSTPEGVDEYPAKPPLPTPLADPVALDEVEMVALGVLL